eukprot:1076414_1
MDEKKEKDTDVSNIKILIIDKGFGNAVQRTKHLASQFVVEKVIVTEPSDGAKYEESLNILIAKILEYKPNVVIASSRGGFYAASLLNHDLQCAFLLLSAMCTQKCCVANKPILLYHAENDGINDINKVKEQCKSYPFSKLIIAPNDTHSLESLKGENNTKINELVLQSIEWFEYCQNDANKQQLLASIDQKQQKKVKNKFDLLNQIQNKQSKKSKKSKKRKKK